MTVIKSGIGYWIAVDGLIDSRALISLTVWINDRQNHVACEMSLYPIEVIIN